MDNEVGAFLRVRRERLSHGDVGLPSPVGRRRGSGLRREDVAALANMSVDYYTRLEQGRTTGVSDSVLDAVGRALHLDRVEREHLAHLARPPVRGGPTVVSATSHDDLLATMTTVPALVLDFAMDLLATNPLAERLFGVTARSAPQPNIALLAFAASGPGLRVRDHTASRGAAVAHLRFQIARRPDSVRLAAVISELEAGSVEFRSLWREQEVRDGAPLLMDFDHPEVGQMTFTATWLVAPTHPDLMLVLYSTEPGSLSAERLARLAPEPSRMRSRSVAATIPRSTAAL